MQTRQIKVIASLLAIAVSGGLLFFRYFQPVPRIESQPHVALGEALAEQTAKALGNGGRITLIAPEASRYKFPGAVIELKAFAEALNRAKLSVALTNRIKLDPLRLARTPAEDFVNILRKQTENDVVVSLLGPPVLTPEQKARLGEKRPRIIAVCSGDMPRYVDLKPLFAENFLYAVVINRHAPGAAPLSDDPSEWFKHSFQWVTTQNLADLPELTGR